MARKRRKLRAVRLTEVPLEDRCAAAAMLARYEKDPAERAKILMAALAPSTNRYWVPS